MDNYLERAEELKSSVEGNYECTTDIQDEQLVEWLIEQAVTLQKIKDEAQEMYDEEINMTDFGERVTTILMGIR
ncbi:hypothetical protein ACOMCU_16180 [Lysinibacillus sp. UGB7]|uniref:hypothetical protein n=1 Tax=Lysinibacillus sp. UGB7 TaxID=3411039 RepID=UPI003B7A7DF9